MCILRVVCAVLSGLIRLFSLLPAVHTLAEMKEPAK